MPNHLQSKSTVGAPGAADYPDRSRAGLSEHRYQVIAATHKSPTEMIVSGIFPEGFVLPAECLSSEFAARTRKEDIPVLLQAFTGNRYAFSEERRVC